MKKHLGKILSSLVPVSVQVADSVPHIPEVAYFSPADEEAFSLSVSAKSTHKSPILQCSNCFLTVHARCYGINDAGVRDVCSKTVTADAEFPSHVGSSLGMTEWTCDACLAGHRPSCILCYMRGGAMKPLQNPVNRFTKRHYWAHLVCILANPGCRFVDIPLRAAAVSTEAITNSLEMLIEGNSQESLVDMHLSKTESSMDLTCADFLVRSCTPSSRPSARPITVSRSARRPRSLSSGHENLKITNYPSMPCSNRLSLYQHGIRAEKRHICLRRRSKFKRNHLLQTDSRSPLLTITDKEKVISRSTCLVCLLPTRGHLPLARCWHDSCSARYHVTCAQMAGVMIGTDQFPNMFYLACDDHPTSYRSVHSWSGNELIKPGDRVMVRKSSNPPVFASAVTLRLVTPLYCRIAFADGTFSKDTPPEYLTNIDWNKDGPPPKGSSVSVLWEDNLQYTGTFQGTTPEQWEVSWLCGQMFLMTANIRMQRLLYFLKSTVFLL
ncbi:hypothetical protein PHET_11226 [Paragonimus heterotremus]|uniref:PHD-type domain-containing protein n=1 Tax=Paragonimus heterotremus TaxID=100268 RepID=A0A8J4T110_9TREM|nr:hypothetical protein PHET_11226 [Paragonimus heterotremus]